MSLLKRLILAVLAALGYLLHLGNTEEIKRIEPSRDVSVYFQEEIDVEPSLEERVIQKIIYLVPTESIAETITSKCFEYTEDPILCVKNVLGVSNAESGMFKQSMYPSHNGFGFMERGKKKKFDSIEQAIEFWIKWYQEKKRYKRTNGDARLKGRYCASECAYRVRNYNDAIEKAGL